MVTLYHTSSFAQNFNLSAIDFLTKVCYNGEMGVLQKSMTPRRERMDRTLLNGAERERIDAMQHYYSALTTMLTAQHATHQLMLAEDYNDIAWASELIESLKFTNGIWNRLMAKMASWRLDHEPLHLRSLCLMDDIIWVLTEETKYRSMHNDLLWKKSCGVDPAGEKAEAALTTAQHLENVKTELIYKLFGENPRSEAILFLRSDAAKYKGMRAYEAVNARAASDPICPRRDTKDVLRLRQTIANIERDYEEALKRF